jgi:hypothetical protein
LGEVLPGLFGARVETVFRVVAPREKIFFFDEPRRLRQRPLVAARVGHVEEGWVLEAVDEEPDLVVGRERHGAVHALHSLALQPGLGLAEQRARHLDVVDGVEITEMPRVVLPGVEPGAVDGCRGASHELPVSPGRQQDHLGVAMERVFFRIEPVAYHHL